MLYCSVVREFIIEQFLFGDSSNLTDETSFLEKGIIDSLGMLDLIVFLENTFCIKIEDDEVIPENMDSINKIALFVERKLKSSRSESIHSRQNKVLVDSYTFPLM